MKLPAASFVSMVDAVLCAVSVLIIMIVVLPRAALRPGYLPRAEMLVSCEAPTPLDMTIAASSPLPDSGGRVQTTVGDTAQQTVLAIRRMLLGELQRLDGVSIRVAIAAGSGPFASHCLDLVSCAMERRDRACRIPGVDPWKLPEGTSIPIVSILYGSPDTPSWQ